MTHDLIWSVLPVLAASQPGGPAPALSAPPETIWDFVLRGGPVMIPIGVCSLVGLAVFVERLGNLRRGSVVPRGFAEGLRGVLRDAASDRGPALDYCAKRPSPLSRVMAAGIRRLGDPEERLERHIQEAGEREVPVLRRRVRLLAVVASIAPLLGLLGTILGMITAFRTVAASADALGKTELLAKGIYEAMITTAAGLIVAIPALLAYHFLIARVDSLVAEIDRLAVEFIEEFGRTAARAPASSAAPGAGADPESNGRAVVVTVPAGRAAAAGL